MPQKSLGLVTIPERTIEHDLTLLQRFQEFSAELLRVALIGISAIGFVVARVVFPEKGATPAVIPPVLKWLLIAALIALGVSAAAALTHRFYSADSMSWHLQAMRRYERNAESDAQKADAEFRARYRQFKISGKAIACSAIALGVGAVLLVVAIIVALS
jgi:hypothetical protein